MKKQRINRSAVTALFMTAAVQAAPLEDRDGNGLWDSWERIHFGTNGVNPESDRDGDGRTEKQEMLAGTDPNRAESRLEFRVQQTNGQMHITFSPLMDMRNYSLDWCASLTNGVWEALTNGTIDSLGTPATILDTDAQQGFYRLTIAASNAPAITASSFENDPPDQVNPPQQAYDGNLSTRWSAMGTNEWIQFIFPTEEIFNTLRMAFHNGDQHVTRFSAASSGDGQAWNRFYTGESSGLSTGLESFVFAPVTSRWFRILGHGNSSNTWNSYTEVEWDYEIPATSTVISSFETIGEWSAGTINSNSFVEGAGSLQWDHGSASSISLTASYPLDLSDGEYISVWVHNELAVENERFVILFYSSGGDYYAQIRTDFVGWKRFVFPKSGFTINNAPEGWHKITSVRFFARGWSNTLNPDRVVLLDDLRLNHSSMNTISPRFLASFESGSIAADVGNEFTQATGGRFSVVDNPSVSPTNPSEKVLLTSIIEEGHRRAEYHAPRMPTREKIYIYAWKELFPTNFTEGVHLNWTSYSVGQWKTWPCEYYGSGIYDFKDEICRGGGIFNHRLITKSFEHEFSFRAMPDCNTYLLPMERGQWHAFALEIYWTNSTNGYYNLYKDGELVESQAGVKTLFDGFIPQTCDMMWGMGLYASWSSTGASSIDYYLDDMAVFDLEEGVSVEEVLEWQGY
jgi:hypothetical protein